MKRVFVCSPFRGDVARNVAVAQEACRRVLLEGDAPFAPHLLYPAMLDDADPAQRIRGIESGLAWLAVADELLVVGEPTEGMRQEIAAAALLGVPVRRVAGPEAPCARRAGGDALRCLIVRAWADWGSLLALVAVVLVFLLCPACVAGARPAVAAPTELPPPAPPTGGT